MRKILFHIITVIALFSIVPYRAGAEKIGAWQLYLSYCNATQNVVAGDIVYSMTDGNLFSYNTRDSEIRTYDKLKLLSDTEIKHIAYSKEAKKLIIVYKNSNIDLLDSNDNIQNLPSLKDKTITDKSVSKVYLHGTMAYLLTGFGFVEIDMKGGLFKNTYRLPFKATSIAVTDKDIYLLTPSPSILTCPIEKNMQKEENWTTVNKGSYWKDITWFNNTLLCLHANGIHNAQTTKKIYDGNFTFMKTSDQQLIWGNKEQISFTTDLTTSTNIKMENNWNDISLDNGIYWVSQNYEGLNAYKFNDNAFSKVTGPIIPNSPIRDAAYRAQWIGDRLLVTGGINTNGANYKPATSMMYENNKWGNFQEMGYNEEYPEINLLNTTHIVQDPKDPNHHFASPYRNGLCEYRDHKFVKLYTSNNSPLKSILSFNKRWYNFVATSGLQYDEEGNLWMFNNSVDTVIRILKNDGKWTSLYFEEIQGATLCDDYLMHSSGLMFMNSRIYEPRGIFCFERKSMTKPQNNKRLLRSVVTNQDGTTYDPMEYYCMSEDYDGHIWVGTSVGLFVILDANTFMNKDFTYHQVKINRNDGSGLADYLLNGVPISCIAVDGGNRKWIGTLENGLYLISPDGQEMIHHFTTENSPLLHNTINTIAIHPTTGEVVIGTEKGLCSYVSDATETVDELKKDNVVVFPNPVNSDYTGPIAIRGLVMDTEVKILSPSGLLIWNGMSNGGICTWNGCDNAGRRVASGVYHVVANNAEGKKAVVTRIVIIK